MLHVVCVREILVYAVQRANDYVGEYLLNSNTLSARANRQQIVSFRRKRKQVISLSVHFFFFFCDQRILV